MPNEAVLEQRDVGGFSAARGEALVRRSSPDPAAEPTAGLIHDEGDLAVRLCGSVGDRPRRRTEHATQFCAYRKPGSGTVVFAGTSPTTTVSFVDAGPLTPGVTYYFWVVGRNFRGEGPEDNHERRTAT